MSGSRACAYKKIIRLLHCSYASTCYSNSPLEDRLVLLRVEWPVLVDVIPHVPVQVVRVVSHVRNRLEDAEHVRLVPLPDALCKVNQPRRLGFRISVPWTLFSSHAQNSPPLIFAYNSGFLYGLTASK